MDENARAREPAEQAASTRRLSELSNGHRREDWPDPLRKPYEPTQDELDLLYSQVPGHRWNGWRCLTGDEDYYAACSCGWRSTETSYVSPMLRQVDDHLNAVRAMRGWRPSAPAAQAPRRDEREHDASQRRLRQERTQELYAFVENQQRRLCQALAHSTDLLSASEDQAERFVAVLQDAAASVAPEQAKAGASAQRAQALQRQAERAKQLRDEIIVAAASLAAIAEEVALINQDLKSRHLSG